MSSLEKVLLGGSVAIVAFDALASAAAVRRGFPYAAAPLGAFLIYAAVGFRAVRAGKGGVRIGALVGAAMGLVDATLGWAVSRAIAPEVSPTDVTVPRWMMVAVMVVLTGAIFGALGGFLARRSRTPVAHADRR